MDAKLFKLRHGLMEILRAGAPMAAGPRQNMGHLLKRQCVYIVIKVRGMRVESAEVEYHLLQVPGVRDAAVAYAEKQKAKMHKEAA